MTDANSVLRPFSQPEDDAAREARHQVLATLLGAYADGELPVETASQVDAHLLGCGRCRSELHVQQAVRERLSHSTVPTATSLLQDRIRAAIAATPVPVVVEAPVPVVRPARRWWYAGALAVVTIAALGAALLRPRVPQLDPPPLVASASVPVLQHLFSDYRRIAQGDLPGRARDLDAVRSAVPFPVTPVTNVDAHLLGAWTTDLEGEPAAVLAYRWHEHVVLQYVVGESALFRFRDLRSAFAARRAVVSQDESEGLIAWPETSAGSVLVGEMLWGELVPLSRAVVR